MNYNMLHNRKSSKSECNHSLYLNGGMARGWGLLIVILMLTVNMSAQSFQSLWQQADKANEQDKPKTALAVLQKIEKKAMAEHQYGHLFASVFSQLGKYSQISEDSLAPAIARINAQDVDLRKKDKVASLMLHLAMLRMERDCGLKIDSSDLYSAYRGFGKINHWDEKSVEENLKKKSLVAELLADPALAAALSKPQSAKAYAPSVLQHPASAYFNHDLISMIATTLDDYQPLIDYYLQQGNRKAACILAAQMLDYEIRNEVDQKATMAKVDKYISQFADLTECGALARTKYDLMDRTVTSRKEVYEWIEEALRRWPDWQEMNYLRNRKNNLIMPRISYSLPSAVLRPSEEIKLSRINICNISQLKFTVTPLKNCPKSLLENCMYEDLAKRLSAYLEKNKAITIEKALEKHPSYEDFTDSLSLGKLPLGTYLVTLLCDGKSLDNTSCVLFVSDLKVIALPLAKNKTRYIVVNATTGKPVSFAKLHLKPNNEAKEQIVQTNATGEYVFEGEKHSYNVYAETDLDRALIFSNIWNSFSTPSKIINRSVRCGLYTDRAIYRPGQKVQVSLLAYNMINKVETAVCPNRNLTITLHDANYNGIANAKITTDDFGVATAEFTLPKSTLCGRFTVSCEQSRASFQVEEYVRPTFEVTIPRPETNYQHGDTITVSGTAKTYSGVPVANARVVYNVKRQTSWWWRNSLRGDDVLLQDTITTDAAGKFTLRMPMMMPHEAIATGNNSRKAWYLIAPMFYDIKAEAIVTDLAGESHSAVLSLPISNRSSVLMSNIKEKMRRDQENSITIKRLNQAGTQIAGLISVAIDGKKLTDLEAGKSFSLPNSLASGKHSLLAICENDTLKSSFVLFSMDDKAPACDTKDWWFQSAEEFSENQTEPVYVQFGTAEREVSAYFTLFADGKEVESGVLSLDSSVVTRQFEYKDEYGDGLNYTVAWVRDGVVYAHAATITRPLKDQRLYLKWQTFRNRLQPGQKETWSVSVTDKAGKPVRANLMATLYDKSLDALLRHNWLSPSSVRIYLPRIIWASPAPIHCFKSGSVPVRYLTEKDLYFDEFNPEYFSFYEHLLYDMDNVRVGYASQESVMAPMSVNGMKKEAKVMRAAALPVKVARKYDAEDDAYFSEEEASLAEASEEKPSAEIPLRENLSETAFFLSNVRTNANGIATLTFTLPESVTTWRFMGLAHDKKVRYGLLSDEAVAQKELMIQPRIPRFLREGDVCRIPSTVANISEKDLNVKVRMEILDAETEKSVAIYNNKVYVKAGETVPVSFSFDSKGHEGKMLIAKITADGGSFTDGEQHYLPILSTKELMLETRTIILKEPCSVPLKTEALLPEKAEKATLTVEYTDAPEWLLIQSLPQIAEPNEQNALSLVAAYCANTLASHIAKSNPLIEKAVREWTKDITSLESPLAKNEELHNLLLAETPWLLSADRETAQRKQLISLFDASLIASRNAVAMKHLRDLQLADGSFSWWKGMKGSRYMTTSVLNSLLRLNMMTGKQQTSASIITKAFAYLDKQIAEDVRLMKEVKKRGEKPYLTDLALDYLYLRAISVNRMTAQAKSNLDFLMTYLVEKTRKDDMMTKAYSAVILARFGKKQMANEYLESILEHTVYREDMGRYFDSYRANYSWMDYRVPTQVTVIEALKALSPQKREYISEMQRWLLNSKRTQAWDSPYNAINAAYAFFGNKAELRHGIAPSVTLNGKALEADNSVSALGYEKYSAEIASSKAKKSTLSIEKKSEGESWANVFVQYVAPASEVKSTANGLSIHRELSSSSLKVGDKVTVTLTIKADRDYDFVTVTDSRPACLEPVSQFSGYRNGCYQVMRDSQSQYHFNVLSKGTHVIKTEYYVSRSGDFSSGTATVQCAYAPEFAGREAGSAQIRCASR